MGAEMVRRLLATTLVLALLLPLIGFAAEAPTPAIVVGHVDGDTVRLHIPAWDVTPFGLMKVRIAGIDTPETSQPPAKCEIEVEKGIAASQYIKSLAKLGDTVLLTFVSFDKYGDRIVGRVQLLDGRDWGETMIQAGHAKPYNGRRKAGWCKIEERFGP